MNKKLFSLIFSTAIILSCFLIFAGCNIIKTNITILGEYGLYDSEGQKLASFEECGINVEINYTLSNYEESTCSAYYVLTNAYTTATKVVLPQTVQTLGDFAFAGCEQLEEIVLNSQIKEIGEFAFKDCKSLVELTIPNNVKVLNKFVFAGCSELQTVNLPDDLKSIKEEAFSGCSKLENLDLPSNITEIQKYAFSNCTALGFTSQTPTQSKYLGNSENPYLYLIIGVSDIYADTILVADNAFEGSTVSGIYIRSNLKHIGKDAFLNCSNLKTLTYKGSIADWCQINFANENANPLNCTHKIDINYAEVTNLEIPNTITEIKPFAFYGGTGFTTITLGNAITKIGDYAFYGCNKIQSLMLPDTIEDIGNFAFYGCTALKNSNNYLGTTQNPYFYLLSVVGVSGTSFEINNNTKIIGSSVFLNSTSFTNVIIPEGLKKISANAFYGSNITELIIPNSVTYVGDQAFKYCQSLETVTIGTSVEYIGYEAFKNCPLASATFLDTENWLIYTGFNLIDDGNLNSEDLAVAQTAADFLKTTYVNKYWKKD